VVLRGTAHQPLIRLSPAKTMQFRTGTGFACASTSIGLHTGRLHRVGCALQ
jgi:hypothetical protein